MAQDIEQTLAERGSRYGDYMAQATIAENIKAIMHSTPGWARLAPDQKEALDMDAVKTARILNGDPDYEDNWRDKEGYSKLVADRLAK